MSDGLKDSLNTLRNVDTSLRLRQAQKEKEEAKRLRSFLNPDETILNALTRLSGKCHQLESEVNRLTAERDELARLLEKAKAQ